MAAMPERSPFWRRLLPGKGRSATGRETRKRQNQPTEQSSVVGPSAISATSKDGMQTSTTSIDVSQPANRLEPISSARQAVATTLTSSLPLPVARGATSDDVATSADVHGTASPPERLWDRAYDELKEEETDLLLAYEKIMSCNLPHEDTVGSTVTESTPNAIVQHDPDARRRQMEQLVHAGLDKTAREAKVKEGLGSTMDTVLSLRNTISSAIQAMPQAALAWTGVCIGLEMLANPIKETEANRDGVVHVIKSMKWYWSLSSSLLKESTDDADKLAKLRRELENQIVDLYKALLKYQIKSVSCYYRHRGLVFLRDMVKLDNWDGDLKVILDAENHFRQNCNVYATQQTNSYLEQLVTHQMSEKDQQCLTDLRTTDPRLDKTRIERTKGGLLRNSYRWILDNPKFRQWRDTPESTLLWIKADPGKGKTMLVCGVVDELRNSTLPGPLSFFFCQATDSRINNATAVLRGLIYLLADQQPSLTSHVRKKYDQAGKSLFDDINSWEALSDIFKNMLHDPNLETTFLVIDALDECVTDLQKLLDFIVNTSSSSTRVKWLLSSRNWLAVEQKLGSPNEQTKLSLELKENAEQVSRAVDMYIDEKLSRVESLEDDGLRDRVRDILRQKANGTFLWVALVVQELEKPESWNPLQVVEEVPTDLFELYDRMVNQIQRLSNYNSELCLLMLSMATAAYSPLHLAEMGSLCGLQGRISALMKTTRKVVAMCGSFLTVRDDQVYLIHQSAKDYLTNEARATIFPSQRKTHHEIFRQSLKLMSGILQRDIYRLATPGFPIDQVQVPDQDPLATTRYSCVHWVDHLCDSVSAQSPRPDNDLQDTSDIYVFLQKQYLYWLESLSLCRSMSEGVVSIAKLESLLQTRTDAPGLLELVRDARRFIMSHKTAIENSPLQAYMSALIFSPAHSLIKGLFRHEEPKWITIKPPISDEWSACLQTLEGHQNSLWSVAFSSNSTQLASASHDMTVKIWDASSSTCLQTLKDHSGIVRSVAFSHNSTRLASASDDKTIKIWDASSGTCLQTLKGHQDIVWSVAFSHNSTQLASASEDNTIKIWDTNSSACLQTLKGHSKSVNSVTFSHDSTQLASASDDKTVKIWDVSSGICLQTLKGHQDTVWSVAFSHDSTQLASVSEDNTVKIWDTNSITCLQTLKGHSKTIRSVAFSHDSTRLASGSNDKTVKTWDASSGACLQTLKGHSSWATSVAFSHDSTRLASASEDKTIKIWDLSNSTSLPTLEGHSDWIRSVAFSHDLTRLASASDDKTVKIWDMSGACLQTLEGHSDWVRSVAFSHDSTRLASGSNDDTVKIWNSSGTCLQTLEGHSGTVRSVAFSHDSTRLASASEDNTVKIWDSSGACLQTLEVRTALSDISFDATGLCLHTEIGTIAINALSPSNTTSIVTKLQGPQYQGGGLSSDGAWITYNSKNVVWLPVEYRPRCSTVLANTVGIGTISAMVWMCSFIKGSGGTLEDILGELGTSRL